MRVVETLTEDLADERARLQDDVPPFPERESVAIIETALGEPVSELFGSFESTPWIRRLAKVSNRALILEPPLDGKLKTTHKKKNSTKTPNKNK